MLNHYRPGCAKALDGETDKVKRLEAVTDYKEKRLQFLLNFNLFTEGFDAPSTRFVVMGRPTKSVLVYTQALGRCTRPLPGLVYGLATKEERHDAIRFSIKPYATVLDFVGASSLSSQAVTATDVLGGNYDPEIKKTANEITGAKPSAEGHVLDSLEKARAFLMLEAEESKLKSARDAIAATEVKYVLEDVKGFSAPGRTAPETSRGDVSDKVVESLLKMGVRYETAIGYSRGQAWSVLKSMRDKHPSVKQSAVLKRNGYNPAEFNFWTAKEKLDEVFAK